MTIDVTESADQLIQQYEGSAKLQALLDGILEIIQDELVEPLLTLQECIAFADASGVFLDYLGLRVGYTRPTILDADVEYFGFNGGDGLGFDQAPMFSLHEVLQARTPVGDEWYRGMLKGRARGLLSDGSIRDLDKVLDVLFDGDSYYVDNLDSTIEAKVTDSRSMYVDVVEETGLMPKPAGVGLTVTEV